MRALFKNKFYVLLIFTAILTSTTIAIKQKSDPNIPRSNDEMFILFGKKSKKHHFNVKIFLKNMVLENYIILWMCVFFNTKYTVLFINVPPPPPPHSAIWDIFLNGTMDQVASQVEGLSKLHLGFVAHLKPGHPWHRKLYHQENYLKLF
ncbi:hypothetical protein ABEB36_012617 [Hypothenemus hampei]|uniref:Transmembrane protein n=1 Tax=Hypothenemus hampei TaxID=57062 RepID=A0ABD1EBV3_HYPHA